MTPKITKRLLDLLTCRKAREVIQHIVTAPDGETYVPGRVLWVLGSVAFLGLSIFAVGWKDQTFDPQSYALGLSAILVAGGAGVWMSSKGDEK